MGTYVFLLVFQWFPACALAQHPVSGPRREASADLTAYAVQREFTFACFSNDFHGFLNDYVRLPPLFPEALRSLIKTYMFYNGFQHLCSTLRAGAFRLAVCCESLVKPQRLSRELFSDASAGARTWDSGHPLRHLWAVPERIMRDLLGCCKMVTLGSAEIANNVCKGF